MSIKELNSIIDQIEDIDLEDDDYEPQVDYYYDWHPTKEDLMAESVNQFDLIHYLVEVLRWYYRAQRWFIIGNLNIYQTARLKEYPLAPNVALFPLVITDEEKSELRSWKMVAPNRPAPTVVFEVASKDTWSDDLRKKPAKYHKMGVREYFTYDPNMPSMWREKRKKVAYRLLGWRYTSDQIEVIKPNENGWLWSNELDSWLVSDGIYLRLYDKDGNMRLSKDEHYQREAARYEREAESASQREATSRAALEQILAKLWASGIDPDKL